MWWLMASASRTFHVQPKHPMVGAALWAFCPMAAHLWREGYPPDDEPTAPWVWGLLRRVQLMTLGGRLADRMAEWGLGGWVDWLRLAVDRGAAFRQRHPTWRAAERTPLFRGILGQEGLARYPPVPPGRASVGWTGEAMAEALLALVFLMEDLGPALAERAGALARLRIAFRPGVRGGRVALLEAVPAGNAREGAGEEEGAEEEEAGGEGHLLLVPLDHGEAAWLGVVRRWLGRPVLGIGSRGEIVEEDAAGRRAADFVESLIPLYAAPGPPAHPAGLLSGACRACGYRRACPAWARRIAAAARLRENETEEDA